MRYTLLRQAAFISLLTFANADYNIDDTNSTIKYTGDWDSEDVGILNWEREPFNKTLSSTVGSPPWEIDIAFTGNGFGFYFTSINDSATWPHISLTYDNGFNDTIFSGVPEPDVLSYNYTSNSLNEAHTLHFTSNDPFRFDYLKVYESSEVHPTASPIPSLAPGASPQLAGSIGRPRPNINIMVGCAIGCVLTVIGAADSLWL